MKKIAVVFSLLLFALTVSAENTPQNGQKDAPKQEVFYFFYSETCPHCHDAMPFVEKLEKENPDIQFKRLEVSKDELNLALFNKKVEKLQIKNVGIPLFIFNDKYVIGFKAGKSEEKIMALLRGVKNQKTESEKPAKPAKPEKSKK